MKTADDDSDDAQVLPGIDPAIVLMTCASVRAMKLKKLDAMIAKYGPAPRGISSCRDCKNLMRTGLRNTQSYFKCRLYGDTRGQGTDWRLNWKGCGAFK